MPRLWSNRPTPTPQDSGVDASASPTGGTPRPPRGTGWLGWLGISALVLVLILANLLLGMLAWVAYERGGDGLVAAAVGAGLIVQAWIAARVYRITSLGDHDTGADALG